MTSFATDEVVRAHVDERGLGEPLTFTQTAAPRLRPDGSSSPKTGARPSTAPGTVTSSACIRASGVLDELAAPRRAARSSSRTSTTSQRGSIPQSRACTSWRARPSPSRSSPRGETAAAPLRVWTAGLSSWRRFGSRPTFDQSDDPGLQHEHVADHGRGAARAGRAHVAPRREAGRRRNSGAVRAALPRALGAMSRRRSSSSRAMAHAGGSCPSRSRPTSRRRGRSYASCSKRRSPARISKSYFQRVCRAPPPGSSTHRLPRCAAQMTPDDEGATFFRHEAVHSPVAGAPLRSGPCVYSMSCCRAAAASAAASARRSATAAGRCSCPAARPGASAAEPPGRGPSAAAPSAAGGGSRSRVPAPRSCTRPMRARSSPPGRSAVAGISTEVAAGIVAAALPRPAADVLVFVPGDRDRELRRGHAPAAALARELSRGLGDPRRAAPAAEARASTVSATCPGRNGAATPRVPSRRAGVRPPASASWTTSTRPGRPRPRARRRSARPARGASTSSALPEQCGSRLGRRAQLMAPPRRRRVTRRAVTRLWRDAA